MRKRHQRAVLGAVLAILAVASVGAAEKPRIGVLRFTAAADEVAWFDPTVAGDLRDLLMQQIGESPLALGTSACLFEVVPEGLPGTNRLHWTQEHRADLEPVLARLSGFDGFVGVTLTRYDPKSGAVVAAVMVHDVDQGSFNFATVEGTVTSGASDELAQLASAITRRITQALAPPTP